MLTVRRADDRGTFDHGWLQTAHTFSFGDYHDPKWTQFRALRVMNEDTVAPGQGFGMHGHRDMEIITVVLSGTLSHRDSLGHEAALKPGEVQYMSAGTGIRHSEFNPSTNEPVHLYQIWLLPRQAGLTPRYEQRPYSVSNRQGCWQAVAAGDGREGAIPIQQDATILLGEIAAGQSLTYDLPKSRHAWLQVMSGVVTVAGNELFMGDGLAVSDQAGLTVAATSLALVILFDLA
ncbi:MAG: pirin family protein [Planctomycetaceae bacterium]|nr:pirin family protein [Planctomycetaceae bacterium]